MLSYTDTLHCITDRGLRNTCATDDHGYVTRVIVTLVPVCSFMT